METWNIFDTVNPFINIYITRCKNASDDYNVKGSYTCAVCAIAFFVLSSAQR